MPSSTAFHVVIPCAGVGNRAGMNMPKQYAMLAGLPLVVHTLKAFNSMPGLVQGVVVVAPDDHLMQRFLQDFPQDKFRIFNTGGNTRAESVMAGLVALNSLGVSENDWVLVHDAARCMITPELIDKLLLACQDDETGGLLALPLPDTLKSETNGRVANTLARNDKWLAQTPQMFRWNLLFQGLSNPTIAITDESSAIEALGLSAMLVEGAAYNFKVTYPEDAAMAAAILNSRKFQEDQR